MANMNNGYNPGAGPLSGVPLRGGFRQIFHGASKMNGPSRGASLAERPGSSQFDTGSGRVAIDIALVKHTPMGTGKTSGVYKGGRPFPFIAIPPAGYKWQVMNKVPAVWCKRFDGSTIARQTHMGGYGARDLKKTEQTEIVLEGRSMEPWGLVVSSCLDCDVREVS